MTVTLLAGKSLQCAFMTLLAGLQFCQGTETLSRSDQTSIMAKVPDKKRRGSATTHGEDSEGEDSGADTKRRASARPTASRYRELMNAPVQAGIKAVVPQQAAAANAKAVIPEQEAAAKARVVAADGETSNVKPIMEYDSFTLEMNRITKGKSSKTAPTVVLSPSQFGSPGRAKKVLTNKVWVAGLKSGEMVAFVTDKKIPQNPAYCRVGMNALRENQKIRDLFKVNEFIHKKADKQPFVVWSEAKISQASQTSYTLHWFVLLRTLKNLDDHTPETRILWGQKLAELFSESDSPNKFEYGGDLSRDKACAASDFFTVHDVMQKLIKTRLDGVLSLSEILANDYIMEIYFGDDPVLNRQVKQFYTPDGQPDDGADPDEVDPNQALLDKFLK